MLVFQDDRKKLVLTKTLNFVELFSIPNIKIERFFCFGLSNRILAQMEDQSISLLLFNEKEFLIRDTFISDVPYGVILCAI